jgi:4-amino-4-deoxy-L-arabinose transferase-like glycosyltransferase
VLAAVLAARFAWLAPRLFAGHLDPADPRLGGDALDWLANGLYYTGADVRFSARPPLVPWVLAGLEGTVGTAWFPLLAQGLFTVTVLAVYRLVRRLHGPGIALAVAAVPAVAASVSALSLQVMADLAAACLLAFAFLALAAAARRPGSYLAAAGWAAASYLAQPAALLLAPAAGVVAAVRRHLRRPVWWAGAALFAAVVAAWAVARRALVGGGTDLLNHWQLVRWHGDAIDEALWGAVAFWGWPAALLAAGGVGLAAGRVLARRDPAEVRLLALLTVAAAGGFFALLYDYPDRRFLLYPAFPGAVLAAEALARLRPPGLRWTAAAAAVLWAALPPHGAVGDTIVVWPWPAVLARAPYGADAAGATRLEPGRARLTVAPAGAAGGGWAWWAELRAAPEAAAPPPDRRRFTRDAGAVLIHPPRAAAERYRATLRLGNALGRRVRFVPGDLVAGSAGWLAAGGAEELGEVAGYRLWRVRPPGLGESWLLAAFPGDPPPVVAPPAGGAPRTADPPLAAARRLAVALPGRTRRVGVVVGPGTEREVATRLAFLLETTELFVVAAGSPAAADLGRLPLVGRRRLGAARISERRFRGEPAWVVDWPGAGGAGAASTPGGAGGTAGAQPRPISSINASANPEVETFVAPSIWRAKS